MTDLTKAVDQVRTARWKMWSQMASKMSDHHILSIELLRTQRNETLAVFTVVRDRKPVQYVLRGDSTGANLKALVSQHHPPIKVGPSYHVEALVMAEPASPSPGGDDGVSADSIALGEPPPKEPPPPGVVALGSSIMPTAFNLGEVAVSSSTKVSQ